MRILLDTNIVIHREAATIVKSSIGVLFRWLDRLKHEKCIHPATIREIGRHRDERVRRSFATKLESYAVLKSLAPEHPSIAALRAQFDQTENDRVDTDILNELIAGRVDGVITEDQKIHQKAALLRTSETVFSIDSFLEKVTAENPELTDYQVLSVRKALFGSVNLNDAFFDSFRNDYPDFDRWFNRKADETAYICTADKGEIIGFLYLKREGAEENYSDITPPFRPKHRIKIGTMKVAANGYKIGERFLKIVFDNAFLTRVSEIYVTAFRRTDDHLRLLSLLEEWGFVKHGTKISQAGEEEVYVRDFTPKIDLQNPKRTYPYMSATARKFIVPIYPQYHTELLPDSVLRTESPLDFVEGRPNRNAISKVYVSRSMFRDLRCGDIIVFYRTASGGAAYYTSVATTLGLVDSAHTGIRSLEQFQRLCRKRSVFTDDELAKHWNYAPHNRPFVVNFLYVYTLPKRMNRKALMESGVINDAPRGFEPLTDQQFERLCKESNADLRYFVD
jgi:predicted nucleic acid-binding protein